MYSNRLIFKTSIDDKVFYLKDTVLVTFKHNRNGISSSQLNGGTCDLYKSVFNQHLSQDRIDYLENHDVCDYLINECKLMDIDSNFSTGLITLAEMNNLSIVSKKYKNVVYQLQELGQILQKQVIQHHTGRKMVNFILELSIQYC